MNVHTQLAMEPGTNGPLPWVGTCMRGYMIKKNNPSYYWRTSCTTWCAGVGRYITRLWFCLVYYQMLPGFFALHCLASSRVMTTSHPVSLPSRAEYLENYNYTSGGMYVCTYSTSQHIRGPRYSYGCRALSRSTLLCASPVRFIWCYLPWNAAVILSRLECLVACCCAQQETSDLQNPGRGWITGAKASVAPLQGSACWRQDSMPQTLLPPVFSCFRGLAPE